MFTEIIPEEKVLPQSLLLIRSSYCGSEANTVKRLALKGEEILCVFSEPDRNEVCAGSPRYPINHDPESGQLVRDSAALLPGWSHAADA